MVQVLDDYSRYILAWKLAKTMASKDVKETLELALAATNFRQVKLRHRPRLLSDNGPCYVSRELEQYLRHRTHPRRSVQTMKIVRRCFSSSSLSLSAFEEAHVKFYPLVIVSIEKVQLFSSWHKGVRMLSKVPVNASSARSRGSDHWEIRQQFPFPACHESYPTSTIKSPIVLSSMSFWRSLSCDSHL